MLYAHFIYRMRTTCPAHFSIWIALTTDEEYELWSLWILIPNKSIAQLIFNVAFEIKSWIKIYWNSKHVLVHNSLMVTCLKKKMPMYFFCTCYTFPLQYISMPYLKRMSCVSKIVLITLTNSAILQAISTCSSALGPNHTQAVTY
jgi:hypothetical protein